MKEAILKNFRYYGTANDASKIIACHCLSKNITRFWDWYNVTPFKTIWNIARMHKIRLKNLDRITGKIR